MQTKQHSLKSDIDIDIYFDSLNLESTGKDVEFDADFEPVVQEPNLESVDLFFKKRAVPIEVSLPEISFASVSNSLVMRKSFSQATLEQIKDEVRLLSQQIKMTPYIMGDRSFEPPFPAEERGIAGFLRTRCLPAGLVGILATGLCWYGYTKGLTMQSFYRAATNMELISQPEVKRLHNLPATNVQSMYQFPSTATGSNPFREAVNQAMSAAELTQTAQTAEEWNRVADLWLEAISSMNVVPQTHPKYSIAVQKVEEYAGNLVYAQSRVKVMVIPKDNTTAQNNITIP